MGLEAGYPYVTMNDPEGHVPVYDQDWTPIGEMGPPPYESSHVNVICRLTKPDGTTWYRLLNPDGWSRPAAAAYVSAAETHEPDPGQPYAMPDCSNVGCAPTATKVAGVGAVAAGATAVALRLRKRRRSG